MPRDELGEITDLIQSTILEKFRALESKGQKELRYTNRAKMQLKNKCWSESSATWQRGQASKLKEEMMEFKRALVGSMFHAIFQKKILSLSLSFNF